MKHFEKILLETAFFCMASDGDVDPREVNTVKKLCKNSDLFEQVDIEAKLNEPIDEINKKGINLISEFLNKIENEGFSKEEEVQIIDFALKTIYADEKIDYSEIKFFKTIRHRLKLSDQDIMDAFPDLDDNFLAADIQTESPIETVTQDFLKTVSLPQFDVIDFTTEKDSEE